MPNTAMDVARYIINHENDRNRSITNLRLQKLLYFCQGAVIATTPDHELCFDDDIEAWEYGPVVPSVYYAYRNNYFFELPRENDIDIDFSDIVSKTLDNASRYSSSNLVNISHNQIPWLKTYRDNQKNLISKDLLKAFFSGEENA